MQAFSKYTLCLLVFFLILFHFMFKLNTFDFPCGWIPALFELYTRTSLYLSLQGLHACVTSCSGATALMAIPCSAANTRTRTHRDIGFARALHTSASLDSSLKCPWQPPNP